MRHIALATAVAASTVVAVGLPVDAAEPATDDLVFSEYVEGSSNNKAIELYNGTGAALPLAGYEVRLYSNGRPLADGPTNSLALPAIDLADGAVYTIGNSQFALPLPSGAAFDTTSSVTFFNGNDALVLVDGSGAVVDSIGQVGDAGTFGAEVTLQRRDFTRDTDPEDVFDRTARYDVLGQNDVGNLGLAPGDDGSGGGGGGDPTPCDTPAEDLTTIAEIQGSNADPDARFDSPLDRETHTIQAVVTLADSDLSGFYVQSAVPDADPTTSDGLFIFENGPLPTEGDTVEVTGRVGAFFGLTQIGADSVEVCDVAPTTIAPTPIVLPLDRDGREALEGMLVTNAQDLQVTRLFTAYRFGELGLALDGPLPQSTSVLAPDDPAIQALIADQADRELVVNDRDEQFSQFNPYPWELFDEDLSAGDTMPADGRLVGALGYAFGEYKIEPLDDRFFPETEDTDVRPDAPALADGNDVVSFNVLNYFNTFGSRGAEDQEQFDLQEAKIVDAITRLDAAVVGLIEIENDYGEFYDDDDTTVPSIVTLVDALNEVAGKNTWSYVRPNENILTLKEDGSPGLGPDEIAVGFVYQRKLATAVGPATTFDIDAQLSGDAENNRWPLAQTFRIDGDDVTVVVNHFKSKGSTCGDTAGPGFELGDDSGSDLLGNCNLTREYAAGQLLDWVESGATNRTTDDVLLIGDFNSYEEEGPIELFVDAGWVDLVQTLGDDAFTYKFDGRYGRLDYVIASPSAAARATDAEVWQINSRAPYGYLYFNDPIDATAHASSDHDPVVVSLG